MSDQPPTEQLDASDTLNPPDNTTRDSQTTKNDSADVEVHAADFQTLYDQGAASTKHSINRFGDIKIAVSAELGRTKISIEKLLSLGKGNVLELDRQIDQPVELIAQGIPLASGEVVVVDDHFALKITHVYPRNRSGEKLAGEE